MSMKKDVIFSASQWEPKMGYSRGVRIDNLVFIAGTVAADGDGNTVGKNAGEQTEYILEKIKHSLDQLGAKIDDVVRTDTFIVNFDKHFEGYAKIHKKYFEKITPVNTTVQIDSLVKPDLYVEISAIAVCQSNGG